MLVMVALEGGDDSVNHPGLENAGFLVGGADLLQAGRGLRAAGGEGVERGETGGVLALVDVHIDILVGRDLQGLIDRKLEALAGGDAQAGHELVDVGGTVGAAHLEGLLVGGVGGNRLLVRIGPGAHIDSGGPSQRHADEGGAVAVAPADVGRRLLVRDEAEVGGGVLVAEGGDGRGHQHQAGDGAAGDVGQLSVRAEGDVLSLLHQAHVDVHARTGLAGGDLRGEGHVQPPLVREVPDHPFRQQKLVGGRFHRIGQEFDLVLLVDHPVQGEVAHFAVPVLDLAAGLGDMDHAGAAEIVHLGEGLGFVIAFLVRGGEEGIGLGDDVVFEFSHRLEGHARGLVEGVRRPQKRLVGGAVEGLAVLVEEAAQEAQRRDLVEGIHERGLVPRDDVQVAVPGLDEGREQAGAVHALAHGEERLGIVEVVYGKVQGFHASVLGGIHEIDHPDPFLPDEGEHIGTGEILRQLAQEGNHLVGVQFNALVHYQLCGYLYAKIMNCERKASNPLRFLISGLGPLLFSETFHTFVLPRGISSVGRALASQAEGREFEPRIPLRSMPGPDAGLFRFPAGG